MLDVPPCCAQVHVILFGVGDFETEGIYSLRALRREDNLPQDTIIAFEDDEDAERCGHHVAVWLSSCRCCCRSKCKRCKVDITSATSSSVTSQSKRHLWVCQRAWFRACVAARGAGSAVYTSAKEC